MATNAPPPRTAREWVGRNIRTIRIERGLTLDGLAELVTSRGFLMDKSQVSKIENGRTNVDVEKLLAFADALEVVPDRLLRDPERLDLELFHRLRRHWHSALTECSRQEAIAVLLLEELNNLADRLPDDPESGYSARDVLEDDSWEVSVTEWTPTVQRVPPEHPGYQDFIERLAAGDLTMTVDDDGSGLDEILRNFTPKKSATKRAATNKKGGK